MKKRKYKLPYKLVKFIDLWNFRLYKMYDEKIYTPVRSYCLNEIIEHHAKEKVKKRNKK
ncbi:MAG: hypothetical protein II393_01630 [Cytophagales bacterium]|nr:hypothetical protein [Cytophagales bacterium]